MEGKRETEKDIEREREGGREKEKECSSFVSVNKPSLLEAPLGDDAATVALG